MKKNKDISDSSLPNLASRVKVIINHPALVWQFAV
jgi:hypothetical protein